MAERARNRRSPESYLKLLVQPDDLVARIAETTGLLGMGKAWVADMRNVSMRTSAKSAKSGTAPVLRMGNIQNAKFDWTDLAYTSDEDEIAKSSSCTMETSQLQPHSTVLNCIVQNCHLQLGERPAIFAGYLIRVNHIRRVADSQYVSLLLNSHVAGSTWQQR